jgi:uncharacterized protein DUF4349
MSRRHETLDPQIARDLAELEAALAGEPGADPALAVLVSDVRAEAPRMSATFALSLDERVAAGFPRPAGRRDHVIAWLTGLRAHGRARLLPVLAVAATALVALVVSVSLLTAGDGGKRDDTAVVGQPETTAEPDTGGPGAGGSAPGAAGGAGSVSDKSTSQPPAPADRLTAARRALQVPQPVLAAPVPGSNRKVEKFTQLTLSTSAEKVQDVSDGVVRVTQGLGGFVEASQVTTTDDQGSATFRLRVPAKRLDEAIRRLSALAHVASLSQSATDITREFVSAADRLSDARAERRALLRALGRATTANQIASLRARLRFNRSEIARYKGELNSVRRRADLATIEVTVDGQGRDKGADGGAWTPRDALGDALRVLEVAAGILVVTAAALVPVALLGLLAALGARAVRRRRREEALDAAA